MKVVIFSNSQSFIKAAKGTCFEMECNYVNVWQKSALETLIKKIPTNLALIDCNTFDVKKTDMTDFLRELTKETYVILTDSRDFMHNKESMLVQIIKQCKLEEIYFYQQFLNILCDSFPPEQEESYSETKNDYQYQYINCNNKLYQFFNDDYSFVNSNSEDYFSNLNLYDTELLKMEPICRKIYGYLNSHKNTPVSINNLCNHVWGIINVNKRKAIYVYIRKIRVFINDNLENPEKLIKIGKGFYTLR